MTCPYWLDLQFFSAEAAENLSYEGVADAIKAETRRLLSRFPELVDIKFQKGVPFASLPYGWNHVGTERWYDHRNSRPRSDLRSLQCLSPRNRAPARPFQTEEEISLAPSDLRLLSQTQRVASSRFRRSADAKWG